MSSGTLVGILFCLHNLLKKNLLENNKGGKNYGSKLYDRRRLQEIN